MANYTSAVKRIRSSEAKRARNRYQHKTTRTFIKRLLQTTDKTAAEQLFPKVCGLVDKLAKRNILHPNKVARKKSQLARFLNKLQTPQVP